MTDAPVLIDSSAWILALRSAPSDVKPLVRQAIESGRAATCGVVRAEVLQGALSQPEFARLAAELDDLVPIPVTEACWSRAALMGFRLRRKGHTVPLTDLVIAVAAQEAGAEILHRDTHFDIIASLEE